ncbi:MAG: hypothetical protein E7524_07220 [Ruminococcaceae bacterium]|nr:hypothetical protein [Oscillospiraceae bacterium]
MDIKSRIFWILGSFVSVFLLFFSILFENAMLIMLDGLIPLAFIIYKYVKREEYPFYYYFICSCGLYFLYWIVFLFPDFEQESTNLSNEINLPTILNSLGEIITIAIYLILLLLVIILIFSKFKKIHITKNDGLVLTIIAVFVLLFSMFASLNIVLDKTSTETLAYVIDNEDRNMQVIGSRPRVPNVGGILHYKYSIDSEEEYFIEHNFNFNPKHYDDNGNPIVKIESGKGAFGLEWRRIVK